MSKKGEIDPEELLKRKFRAKCLFRALGRLVMANTYWLIESIDEYEGVDDVQRRVQQAVRGRAKKQLLSVKDKALLNKPAEDRTDHEKKYIYRIIGGLKCFKRYPNHVKKKLAAVTYFKYYGPDRVIVREKQEAHALYFIVSGEVVVSQLVWDDLIEEFVVNEIARMTSGDMFGEISLLHNIPRTATVTTTDHCEFLQVLREDFKSILLASVQKQWDEVRYAMSAFSYFDALDEVACREGCIMAKMKNYAANETILGDGYGIANHVYFLLSGRVQMIESMKVIVGSRLGGKKTYTLYDPYVSPEPSEEDFDKKWFAAYKKNDSEDRSGSEIKHDVGTQTGRSSILKSRKSIIDGSSTSKGFESKEGSKTQEIDAKESSQPKVDEQTTSEETKQPTEGAEEKKGSIEEIKAVNIEKVDVAVGPDDAVLKESRASFPLVEIKPGEERKSRQSEIMAIFEGGRPSVRMSLAPEIIVEEMLAKDKKLKTYFMQVCVMNPGSTFGFGENMRDRRMVALVPVSCMLMPKMWLLQRNTANIWTRIQYYLNKKIPTKKVIFEEFVRQRAWEEYKQQCVDDVIARTKNVNFTSAHDVPYSIRLEEMFDI